mmetsp:Transcript_13384/g.40422  ORF Transcript_13384/g.40422 Transcript_13384/m.40422 type:complete len:259 (+) Transcript_13384:48-824(+)
MTFARSKDVKLGDSFASISRCTTKDVDHCVVYHLSRGILTSWRCLHRARALFPGHRIGVETMHHIHLEALATGGEATDHVHTVLDHHRGGSNTRRNRARHCRLTPLPGGGVEHMQFVVGFTSSGCTAKHVHLGADGAGDVTVTRRRQSTAHGRHLPRVSSGVVDGDVVEALGEIRTAKDQHFAATERSGSMPTAGHRCRASHTRLAPCQRRTVQTAHVVQCQLGLAGKDVDLLTDQRSTVTMSRAGCHSSHLRNLPTF